MSYAEAHHDLVGGLASAAGLAIFSGMAQGRAKHAARMENFAACDAAAVGAAADVYQSSAASLRERLADAEEDVAFISAQRDEAERKLALMIAYVADLRAAGRIAA